MRKGLKDSKVFVDEEEREKHRVKLREGRNLARMRQSPFCSKQICLGGKETDLQVRILSVIFLMSSISPPAGVGPGEARPATLQGQECQT